MTAQEKITQILDNAIATIGEVESDSRQDSVMKSAMILSLNQLILQITNEVHVGPIPMEGGKAK